MNRYYGNSGRMERLPETGNPPPPPPPAPPLPKKPPPRPAKGGLELGKLLERLDPRRLEQEDLMLALMLYLLYRESGEQELLIVLLAMLVL